MPENVNEIEFDKLEANIISMDFFDILEKSNITINDGYIRKEMEEIVDGISVADRLRYSLIMEDSEYYLIFNENDRKEFLFHLFKNISLGGPICQYEDNVNEYLNATKLVYKDLIQVIMDSDTKEIKVISHVFKIKSVQKVNLFDNDHIQNFFYLIIDPSNRIVSVLYHKWTKFW